MKLEGRSLIGTGLGAAGGQTFTGLNPATGQALPGEFHSASTADVHTAAGLAGEAFAEYSEWPGEKRAAMLHRISEALEKHAPMIIERAHLETALPRLRLEGELARTCLQLRMYGAAAASGLVAGARIDHAEPDRKPLPKPDLRSLMIPLGTVAVFGASNFPLAYSVAGGDTASALAAGCPVIVKAHPAHPGTSEIVGHLARQAVIAGGAPAGVFAMLFDAGYNVGAALVRHPAVKAVGFTGSRHGGRALMDLAAARPEPIPVYAEMSSINPVFILAGALAQKAEELAIGLSGSVTLGMGQFCTNPGLVLIESGEGTQRFLARLKQSITASAPGTMLTPGICAAYRQGTDTFAQTPGVRQLASVNAGADENTAQAGAASFATDAATFLANPALMHEVFGPSTLVVECPSHTQMLAIAHRLEGQLTATIHALPDELNSNRELLGILSHKAGRLLFGGFPTGVEVTHAMTHGGPYPATSDGRSTSVGTRALERFLRPLTYQNFPDAALPPELQEGNPLKITRLVNGKLVIT